MGYYYIKINYIRLQYYEKIDKYGYKFRVIDSIPDLKKKKNEHIRNVSEIWVGVPHYTMHQKK